MIPSQQHWWKFLHQCPLTFDNISSDRRRRAISLAVMVLTTSSTDVKSMSSIRWPSVETKQIEGASCSSAIIGFQMFYQPQHATFCLPGLDQLYLSIVLFHQKGRVIPYSPFSWQLSTQNFAQGATRRRPSESTSLLGVDLETPRAGESISSYRLKTLLYNLKVGGKNLNKGWKLSPSFLRMRMVHPSFCDALTEWTSRLPHSLRIAPTTFWGEGRLSSNLCDESHPYPWSKISESSESLNKPTGV